MCEKYKIPIIFYDNLNLDKCWYSKEGERCHNDQVENKFCSEHTSIHYTPDCVVCTEEFTPLDAKLEPCGHWIHKKCIFKSGKTICPICRAELILTKDEKKCMKVVKYEEQPNLSPEMNLNDQYPHQYYDNANIHDIYDQLPEGFEGFITIS